MCGLCITGLSFSALTCMQKQNYTCSPSHNGKKRYYWHMSLVSPKPKQTHQRNLPPFSPNNTQHLNVIAKAVQAFIWIDVWRCSHCDTPSVGEGPGSMHGQSPTARSICVGDAAELGPLACGGDGSLTGASASMDQLGIRCTHAQKTCTSAHPLNYTKTCTKIKYT